MSTTVKSFCSSTTRPKSRSHLTSAETVQKERLAEEGRLLVEEGLLWEGTGHPRQSWEARQKVEEGHLKVEEGLLWVVEDLLLAAVGLLWVEVHLKVEEGLLWAVADLLWAVAGLLWVVAGLLWVVAGL